MNPDSASSQLGDLGQVTSPHEPQLVPSVKWVCSQCVENSTRLCKQDQCLHVPATLRTLPPPNLLPARPHPPPHTLPLSWQRLALGGTGSSVREGECGGAPTLQSWPGSPRPAPRPGWLPGIATHPCVVPGPPLVPARGCPGRLCSAFLLRGGPQGRPCFTPHALCRLPGMTPQGSGAP